MTTEFVQTNEYGETTKIVHTNEYGEVATDIVPTAALPPADPMITADFSTTETAEDAWKSFQGKAADFSANASHSIETFFQNNRQLLTTLGWIFLAFLGIRVLFAALDAIDDIPLMSPLLKLVGLVSVSRFVWRYLVRASDRQELSQKFNQAKADLLGK